jgi:CheY-like chemotaxis protein
VKERVLIIDDEPPILRSLARLLAFEPYELVTANNGQEGLRLLDQATTAVVLSDYHMAGMGGAELLREARLRSPDTSRILFSGHIDVELIRSAVNAGEVYRFLTKPWNDDELLLAVRHGVERCQLMRHNRLLNQRAEEQNRQLKRFNGELELMVASRTEALELRNRALTLSQEVLDGLPVAVIGLAPDGQVALANDMARRMFPGLLPGEAASASLPEPFWEWSAGAFKEGSSLMVHGPLGPMRFEVMSLGDRGLVMTAIPLDQSELPRGEGLPKLGERRAAP